MVERLDLQTWLNRCFDEIIATGKRSGWGDPTNEVDCAEFDAMFAALGENNTGIAMLLDA